MLSADLLWLLPVIPVLSAIAADFAARRGWRSFLLAASAGYSTITWVLVLVLSYAFAFRNPLEPFVITLFVAILCWISLFMRWRPHKQ